MELSMGKYYRWAATYPAIFVFIITAIITILESKSSRFLTKGEAVMLTLTVTFFYLIFMMLVSIPIVLNKYPSIRDNFLSSVISWLLLPFTFILISIYTVFSEGHQSYEDYYFILFNLPFVFSLLFTFIHFRGNLENENLKK